MAEADREQALAYLHQVTWRALGGAPVPVGPLDHRPSLIVHQLGVARDHASLDAAARHPTRFQFAKKLILRAARLFLHEQVAYNEAIVDAVADLDNRLQVLRADLERELGAMRGRVVNAHLVADDALGRIEEREQLTEQLSAQLEAALAAIDRLEAETRGLRADLAAQPRQERQPVVAADSSVGREDPDLGVAASTIYADIEDRFRGSRESIAAQQRHYVRHVAHLRGGDLPVFDVGCGRGEWLEVLRDEDIPAVGYDVNETFVARNKELGLDARLGDALDELDQAPPGSLGAVTAFHVVEHLPFEVLLGFLDAARRALAAGGVLILETPNPSNVRVGAAQFWMDPTHQRPLPSELLHALVEQRGFHEAVVEFLHEVDEPRFRSRNDADAARVADALNWALLGPQDYAVVARRP